MKPIPVATLILVLLGVVACGQERPPPIEELWAGLDRAMSEWTWENERAEAAWCAEHQTGPRFHSEFKSTRPGESHPAVHYGGRAVSFGQTRISIREGAKEKFSWVGTLSSVWHVVDHHIYFLDFLPGITGGTLVAADLDTGQTLWDVPLAGAQLGLYGHWSNRKIIKVKGERICVWSMDGRKYLEIRERLRGQVIALRCFPD